MIFPEKSLLKKTGIVQKIQKKQRHFIGNFFQKPKNINVSSEFYFFFINGTFIPFLCSFSVSEQQFHLTLSEKDSQILLPHLPIEFYSLSEQKEEKMSSENYLGYKIIDTNSTELGEVIAFLEHKKNPVFEVLSEGKEVLIPFSYTFVQSVSHKDKIIKVQNVSTIFDFYKTLDDE